MIVGLELLLLSYSVTDYDYDCDYYLLNAEVRKPEGTCTSNLGGILSEA